MKLFRGLEDAFTSSTSIKNKFMEVVNRIRWDSAEFVEDEYVFRLGDLTFTTPSLVPDECKRMWSPAVQLASGELLFIFA